MIGFFIINSKLIPLGKLKRVLLIALLVSYCLPQGGDIPETVTIIETNFLNYYSTDYSTNITSYGHAGIIKGNLNNISNINPALLKRTKNITVGFSCFSEDLGYYDFYKSLGIKVNNPLLESWSILIPGDLSISIGSNMKYNLTVEYDMPVITFKNRFKIQTYSVNISKELDKNITIGFKYNRDNLFKKERIYYTTSLEVKDHVDYWGVGLLYNKNFGNIGMMYLHGKTLFRTRTYEGPQDITPDNEGEGSVENSISLTSYYNVPSILGIGISHFDNSLTYLINVKKIFWNNDTSNPYEENILTAGVQYYITDSFELSLTTTLNDYNFDNDFHERKIITIGGIYKSQYYDIDLTYGSTYDAEEEDFFGISNEVNYFRLGLIVHIPMAKGLITN